MQCPVSPATQVSLFALALALSSTHALAQSGAEASKQKEKQAQIEELVVIGEPVDSLLTSADLERKQANDSSRWSCSQSMAAMGVNIWLQESALCQNPFTNTLRLTSETILFS